jgi:hypothetical protein
MITKFKLFENINLFVYVIDSGDGLKKDTKYQVSKIKLEWDDNVYFTLKEFPDRIFKKDRFISEDEYITKKYNI